VHFTPAGGRWLAGPIIDAIFSPTPEEAAEAARIMAAAKDEAAEVAAALTGGR
jgi:citrate lyase beta subunit